MCLHTVLLFRILKQIHILQLLLQSLLLLLLLPYYYSTTATTTLLILLLLLSDCLSVSTLLQYSSLYIQIHYYYYNFQMKITYILTTTIIKTPPSLALLLTQNPTIPSPALPQYPRDEYSGSGAQIPVLPLHYHFLLAFV